MLGVGRIALQSHLISIWIFFSQWVISVNNFGCFKKPWIPTKKLRSRWWEADGSFNLFLNYSWHIRHRNLQVIYFFMVHFAAVFIVITNKYIISLMEHWLISMSKKKNPQKKTSTHNAYASKRTQKGENTSPTEYSRVVGPVWSKGFWKQDVITAECDLLSFRYDLLVIVQFPSHLAPLSNGVTLGNLCAFPS